MNLDRILIYYDGWRAKLNEINRKERVRKTWVVRANRRRLLTTAISKQRELSDPPLICSFKISLLFKNRGGSSSSIHLPYMNTLQSKISFSYYLFRVPFDFWSMTCHWLFLLQFLLFIFGTHILQIPYHIKSSHQLG